MPSSRSMPASVPAKRPGWLPPVVAVAVAIGFMFTLAFADAGSRQAAPAAVQLAGVHRAPPKPHWVRLCGQYQFAVEHTTWSALAIVRNDWWGQHGCIVTNTAARDNFRVATSYRWTGAVQAFPETFRGCEYSRCTPNPGFPVRGQPAGAPGGAVAHARPGGGRVV